MCNKFYVCEKCGNLVGVIECGGGSLVCCGAKMKAIEAGVVEASREKHIPDVKVEGNTVKVTVGSVIHPMSEEHHISWIYLETSKGGQRRALSYDGTPEATFTLSDGETPVSVYAYCNLHGLWKADL
ncbi:MAG: desulfoferrodoxin [Clostridia bacterium]|nr:desulfoferrodoxin [Clostridia bacterium]